MSSDSITASSDNVVVLGRKLFVHVAENGHSLEFECDGSTPVEAIQRSIEALCGVPTGDQLLLCRNTSLDSQQQLSYYKLPQDDREVFLYNKARLHADSPRPLPEAIDVPEPTMPPPLSPAQESHPLDKAPDPALKALISYERQFRYHFQFAHGIYSCTQAKFEISKRLVREQQVQERALETARGNLELTYRKLHQRYSDFFRCFAQQHKGHADLLANFERDVERLRALKLYPSLQSEGRKCLLDLVKVDDLRKWADVCFISHRQFEVKVIQLKANFGELKRRVDSLFSFMASSSCRDLELMIRDHQKVLNDQKSVMQSLSKDVNTAKRLVDETDSQQSASLRPHDAVSALGRMYDVHEKSHLPNVQNCDHDISKLLDNCMGRKNDLNLKVHISMQKVKSVQISIKDMINELHAFQEVMGHQEREFENLKLVNGIGHAYRACLAEIVRRKSSLKLYMGLAGQLAERLAAEREIEIRKREEFSKAWSKYMPHDILAAMGLFDSPSQCDVNITPFDGNLLNIDLVDVDRYAPQSLISLLSKPERNVLTKGTVGPSGSNIINNAGQSSIHSGEQMESQELLVGYESIDIAGTSKMEVENARLKAELASAIAVICTLNAEMEIGYDSTDEVTAENMFKSIKEKTAEALHLKDEHAKHLQSMLNVKQEQCLSYEKRIQELEQRLSEHYLQGQKLAAVGNSSDSVLSVIKSDHGKLDIFGDGEGKMGYLSTMPMDEISSTSALVDSKLDHIIRQESKPAEGGDENMTDLSGTVSAQPVGFTRNLMDASMHETSQDETLVGQVGSEGKDVQRLIVTDTSNNVRSEVPQDMLPCESVTEPSSELKISNTDIEALESALAEKSKLYDEIENELNATIEQVSSLRRELEISRNLLDESQMNCAHLENCLHEAREEARTNLCAADRRASEYNALRTSAIKMRSLFERLRSCITSSSGVAGFADSLRSLAMSLASSLNEDEDAGTKEFQACVKVLADKVTFLSRHRAELSERCSKFEAANGTLTRDLEEKKERINKLYAKLQASIAFSHFELRDRAAFVLNAAGHYEAINRNCSNYYLSEESVALFKEQNSSRPAYIIGQIVHIEQHIVMPLTSLRTEHGDQVESSNYEIGNRRSSGSGASWNPYNLPIGCEYYIVTVAMLPDTIH